MPTTKYRADPMFIPRLAMSSGVQKAVIAHANQFLPLIQARVPKRTGRLAASLMVEPAICYTPWVQRGVQVRAGAKLVARTPYAAAVEWGSRDGDGKRVIGKHFLRRSIPLIRTR